MPSPTENYSEKYLKRSIRRTDLEDALKRLDTFTHEVARMATAQALEATHLVDGRVQEVHAHVQSVRDDVRDIHIHGTQMAFSC